jgi:hypothetical protein
MAFKGKFEVFTVNNMKALGGAIGQMYATVAVTAGKSPRVPLSRRLCGPQNRSARSGEQTPSGTAGCRTSSDVHP